MFAKLKARAIEIKNDPFYQGAALATVSASIGAYGAVKYAHKTGMIFGPYDLNIPDAVADHILETGIPVLIQCRKTGTQLSIGPS